MQSLNSNFLAMFGPRTRKIKLVARITVVKKSDSSWHAPFAKEELEVQRFIGRVGVANSHLDLKAGIRETLDILDSGDVTL